MKRSTVSPVRGSFIFGEVHSTLADGFGDEAKLDLTDKITVLFGVALDLYN